jgi:hypothetical protein
MMIEVIIGMIIGVLVFVSGLFLGLKISKHDMVMPKPKIEPQDDTREYLEEWKKAHKKVILPKVVKESIQDDEEEMKEEYVEDK